VSLLFGGEIQRELPLPPPVELPPLDGRETNEGRALLLGEPRFHWPTGKWISLAVVAGALVLVEVTITVNGVAVPGPCSPNGEEGPKLPGGVDSPRVATPAGVPVAGSGE